MNPQFVYHAYAMTYLELDRARAEQSPVPTSVVARLASSRGPVRAAVMRAMRDVACIRPMRPKAELVALLERAALAGS